VLDKEAGRDHAHAVVHPAAGPQLAFRHPRWDSRCGPAARRPGLADRRARPAPRRRAWRGGRRIGKLRNQVLRISRQASSERRFPPIRPASIAACQRGADLAKGQMRRKAAGALHRGQVAPRLIGVGAGRKASSRAAAPASPGVHSGRKPPPSRALRAAGPMRQIARGPCGSAGRLPARAAAARAASATATPARRACRCDRRARPAGDTARRQQEIAIVQVQIQRAAHRLGIAPPWFVVMQGVHFPRAGFLRQRASTCPASPRRSTRRLPRAPDRAKAGQRAMQPPARGRPSRRWRGVSSSST
jgi:hypothetical protein